MSPNCRRRRGRQGKHRTGHLAAVRRSAASWRSREQRKQVLTVAPARIRTMKCPGMLTHRMHQGEHNHGRGARQSLPRGSLSSVSTTPNDAPRGGAGAGQCRRDVDARAQIWHKHRKRVQPRPRRRLVQQMNTPTLRQTGTVRGGAPQGGCAAGERGPPPPPPPPPSNKVNRRSHSLHIQSRL